MIEPDQLRDFVNGDLRWVDAVFGVDHAALEAASREQSELVVRPGAVARVLNYLVKHPHRAQDVKRWALFVRSGETWTTKRPIQQLDIKYDAACEDTIARAISRLAEIGDAIDGTITEDKALEMLAQIEQCQQ